MASTYSSLKIQLMTTGENSGTWGNVTNINLGTAIEEAITGSANVTFSSANVTLTLTDTNSSQTARNLRLNLTGTTGGARDLIVPAIEKVYLVNNGCADAVTVKNTTGTGIAVPAGKTMWVFNNGTNVVDAVTHLTSLTLASALPVTSGGTGVTTSTGSGNVVLSSSPTLSSPTFTAPILGTPASGTLTNCTGLPIATGVAGLGTGVATFLATPSSANLAAAVTGETGSGALVFGTAPTLASPVLTTPVLGTPSSGTLTSCTGLPLTTGVTGTLPVANGGTGITSFGAGIATFLGTPSSANLAAAVTDETGSGSLVFGTSPTIASPALTGTPTAPTATSGTNTTQLATTAFVTTATSALGTTKADKTTTISAGTGLSGGGDLSANRTLAIANTGVSAATYGSATTSAVVAVNSQGQITSASNATIPIPGVGQTWQDVTGSRSSGTTYTNNTGKPITVFFSCGHISSTVIVGGVTISSVSNAPDWFPYSMTFIVPDNTTYSITFNTVSRTWSELR